MTIDPESDPVPALVTASALPASVELSRQDFGRLASAMGLDDETVDTLHPMVVSLRTLALAVDQAMLASDGVAASEDAVPPL